jgi:hypothetical protein
MIKYGHEESKTKDLKGVISEFVDWLNITKKLN